MHLKGLALLAAVLPVISAAPATTASENAGLVAKSALEDRTTASCPAGGEGFALQTGSWFKIRLVSDGGDAEAGCSLNWNIANIGTLSWAGDCEDLYNGKLQASSQGSGWKVSSSCNINTGGPNGLNECAVDHHICFDSALTGKCCQKVNHGNCQLVDSGEGDSTDKCYYNTGGWFT